MFYGKAIGKYRQFSRVVGWALEATGAAAHGNTDQVLNNGLQTGLGAAFSMRVQPGHSRKILF
jgi:hypothetical protein